MPTWSTDIPKEPRGPALPIRRTPPCGSLNAIVTSPNLIGTYTHFYKGRTMPCTQPKCEAHDHGVPYRWHAYVTALDLKAHLHFIFETTAQAAESFTLYRDQQGTLRGCLFDARRWSSKANGRIVIRTKPADLSDIRLPNPPDLIQCLSILWSLPAPELDATHQNPENKTREVVHVAPETLSRSDLENAIALHGNNPPHT